MRHYRTILITKKSYDDCQQVRHDDNHHAFSHSVPLFCGSKAFRLPPSFNTCQQRMEKRIQKRKRKKHTHAHTPRQCAESRACRMATTSICACFRHRYNKPSALAMNQRCWNEYINIRRIEEYKKNLCFCKKQVKERRIYGNEVITSRVVEIDLLSFLFHRRTILQTTRNVDHVRFNLTLVRQ